MGARAEARTSPDACVAVGTQTQSVVQSDQSDQCDQMVVAERAATSEHREGKFSLVIEDPSERGYRTEVVEERPTALCLGRLSVARRIYHLMYMILVSTPCRFTCIRRLVASRWSRDVLLSAIA